MPWEALLAGGVPTLAFVLVAYLLYTAITKAVATASSNFLDAQKNLRAFTQTIDSDLRARRFDAYTPLWTLTEAFPRFPARRPVSYDALLPFSESLRDWYFRTGGILLSVHARDAYFAVQRELRLHIDTGRTDRLEDEVYDAIRDRCSALRTELTDDLLSRLAAPEVTRTGAA